MVLAWIAVVAATVVVAPRLAGECSTEFATAGSESQATADLVAERFPGTSGDTIEVVWRAQGGAAMLSASVAEYDIADVRHLFGERTA